VIQDGCEPPEFWHMWGYKSETPKTTSEINNEWNNWYLEIDQLEVLWLVQTKEL
jgi:hypothetical protein